MRRPRGERAFTHTAMASRAPSILALADEDPVVAELVRAQAEHVVDYTRTLVRACGLDRSADPVTVVVGGGPVARTHGPHVHGSHHDLRPIRRRGRPARQSRPPWWERSSMPWQKVVFHSVRSVRERLSLAVGRAPETGGQATFEVL